MLERRRSQRIKDDISVMFDQLDKKILEENLQCVDISAGGMQVISARKLEPGQLLKCKLGVLTDVIPLEIEARVVTVRDKSKGERKEFVVGLEFVFNDDLIRDRLKDYIRRRILSIQG